LPSATFRPRGRSLRHLIRTATFWAALLLIAPGAALAQSAVPAPVPAPAPAAESAPQAREDMRQLLETLRNPEKRAALERQIEGLLAVQEQVAPPPEEHGLGASVLATLSAGFRELGGFVAGMSGAFGDSGRLWAWLERQTISPAMRALWLDIFAGAALSIGGALLAAFALRFALAPARRRLARRAEGGLFRRIRFSAARVVLDLVPAFAFAIVALGVLVWAAPPEPARLVLLAILNAAVVSMAALAIGRWLFSPMLPELRVVPLSDATAVYLYIWSRRLILVLVWGYVVLQAALLLGLPSAGYLVALKLLGLLVTALLVVLILQNRETVARHIRGRPAAVVDERRGRRIILPGPLRNRLAEIWHVLALIYVVGVYAVWALEISGGFLYLMRATALSLLVIALVAAGEIWVPRLFDRLSGIDAALRQHYPFVADRANRYLPVLRRVAVYAFRVAALLIILAAWQVDVAGMLFGETGRTILSRLADIAIVLVLALVAWEISSGLITAHLNRRDASGIAVIRSARVRTLLPLIRNALLILISVMATLVVLSEIGVDIAPLLAGAGVVGLAIGFGAQSLVKDVITGAFFMVEGTMNIGDVVDINGKGGLVEGMTVRSIRLRDYNGAVHTINFGSVGTVTNMTRDFSYFLFDTKVALRYDVDAVIDVLRRTDEEMRADARYAHDILAPLEIAGVEAFGDTTFIIRSRLKTRPIRQWDLGRAFLRRLKRNMAAANIEMAVPALPAHVTFTGRPHGNGHAAASTVVRQAPDQDDAEDQAQAEDRPGRVSSP